MPKFYNQTKEELEAPPPSYGQMTKMVSDRVKRRVKNTIMPKVRAKVAALGKAKVAQKKAQAVSLTKAAGKMDGRVKKKLVKEEKKAKAKVKAKVRRKMPRIRQKVADLGASKVREKVKVGKAIKKKMDTRNEEGAEVVELTKTQAHSSIFDYLDREYEVDGKPLKSVYYDELTGEVFDPDDYDILGNYNNRVFRPNKKMFK